MPSAVIRIAFQEWWRSLFGDAPRGVGARDFRLLTLFALLVAFFTIFGLVAAKTISTRFEQTLLGALKPDDTEVRTRNHWMTAGEVSPRSLLAIHQDPAMQDYTVLPRRVETLGQGMVRMPRAPASDPRAEASLQLRLDSLPVVSLPHDAPLWGWVQSEAGQAFVLPEGCAQVELDRRLLGNAVLLDEAWPPAEHYPGYRKTILVRPENSVLVRYLPETITSWSDLDPLVLAVSEVIDQKSVMTFHPFQVIWREGLPLTERPALVLPLGFRDALDAAGSRIGSLAFAPEGCGAPATRYRAIEAEVSIPGLDEDEAKRDPENAARVLAEQQAQAARDRADLKQVVDRLAVCLGDGAELIEEPGRFTLQPRPNPRSDGLGSGARSAWREEDVLHCMAETRTVPDQFWLQRVLVGKPLAPMLLDGRRFAGAFASTCDAMDDTDRSIRTLLGHGSVTRCAAGAENGPQDGLILRSSYPDVNFMPPRATGPVTDVERMARAMRRWTRNDSGTDRPESFLEVWNVAAARERAARFDGDAAWLSDLDAVVFDLAPDLESEAREAIAAANTAFRANDDRVAILTLDPGYQRSLTQYHFAQQLLGKVSLLVAVATLVMMVFVIKLMTTSTLERRLSQYSLFATFGLSRADMIAMILVQVSLSALVGIAIATLCFPRLVRAANAALDESGLTVDLYRELGFAFPEGLVLDLDRGLYVFAGVTVFVVFTGLAALSAWLLGILGARYPSQYVQRKGDRRQAPVAGEA